MCPLLAARLQPYRLNVTEHGLDAALSLRDREGRDVRFEVVETQGTPRLGALIAPVGAQVGRPAYLPIVLLDDFALVRRRGARIEVWIGGQRRTPDKMTRLVRGPASFFTRYSARVVIANWNERRAERLDPLPLPPGAAEVRLVFQPLDAWQPPILDGPPWVASYRYEAVVGSDSAGIHLAAEWRRVE